MWAGPAFAGRSAAQSLLLTLAIAFQRLLPILELTDAYTLIPAHTLLWALG
jgi:hypothetical protein